MNRRTDRRYEPALGSAEDRAVVDAEVLRVEEDAPAPVDAASVAPPSPDRDRAVPPGQGDEREAPAVEPQRMRSPADEAAAAARRLPPQIGEGLLGVRRLTLELKGPGRRRRRAIDELSLDLRRGEMLGLVGESGAGKSLLAAALLGLLPASAEITHGKLWFGGDRMDILSDAGRSELRGRRIAAVFQDAQAALDPLFTVGDQLVETLRCHHEMDRGEAAERAVELLEEVGLSPAAACLDRYPHELSGGQRQRVVLALALAGEPDVLIADEPTTALDVSVQAQVVDLLIRLARKRGLGVLLITHDLALVAEVCDRVIVMYAGRLVEEGPVVEVLRRPAHPYTAGLLAAMPRLHDAGLSSKPIPGQMPPPGEWPRGCAFHPRCARSEGECRSHVPETTLRGPDGRIGVRVLAIEQRDRPSLRWAPNTPAPKALGQFACWHPLNGEPDGPSIFDTARKTRYGEPVRVPKKVPTA